MHDRQYKYITNIYKYDLINYSQLPLYHSRRGLYYLFDITKFRYKRSYNNGLEVLGEDIHFDISGYFDISEFDIKGVDCMSKVLMKMRSFVLE